MGREGIITDKYDDTALHPLSFLQGSAKRRCPGLVNFIPAAVAYHFCLALPGDHLSAEPCSGHQMGSPVATPS